MLGRFINIHHARLYLPSSCPVRGVCVCWRKDPARGSVILLAPGHPHTTSTPTPRLHLLHLTPPHSRLVPSRSKTHSYTDIHTCTHTPPAHPLHGYTFFTYRSKTPAALKHIHTQTPAPPVHPDHCHSLHLQHNSLVPGCLL